MRDKNIPLEHGREGKGADKEINVHSHNSGDEELFELASSEIFYACYFYL